MFDLMEHVKRFQTDDGSVDLDAMRQDNVARWERAELLENDILALAGQMNSVQYRFIKCLGEFDDTGGWQGEGIHSLAHWLNWKIGMGRVMGREKVRVARALPDLPLIDEAFSSGKISYSKVRAMTRVATPENEHLLLQVAEDGTANHIEKLVRKFEFCKRIQEPRSSDRWKQYKDLGWYQDELGMIVIHARLPPEEGALVIKALEIIQAENRREKEDAVRNEDDESELKVDSNNVSAETSGQAFSSESFSEDMPKEDHIEEGASALTHLAESFLTGNTRTGDTQAGARSLGEKYQIFLHINANAASRDHRIAQSDHAVIDIKSDTKLDTSRFIAPEVARRLACDASLSAVLEDDDGNVLNIGRRSRIVPRAISHALRIRDGGCRYPGCCQSRYTDAHHIRHWAEGGETSMNNLVTLCRFHHGLLHKGEYRIHLNEHKDLVFTNNHNEVMVQSFFPQFPDMPNAKYCLDADMTRNAKRARWLGEGIDIQHALQNLFRYDKSPPM